MPAFRVAAVRLVRGRRSARGNRFGTDSLGMYCAPRLLTVYPRLSVKRRDGAGQMARIVSLDCGGKRSATPLLARRARPQSGVALTLPAAVQTRRIANLTDSLGMYFVPRVLSAARIIALRERGWIALLPAR